MKNKTKQKIDTLYKEIAPIQQEIDKLIKIEEFSVQIPRLRKMVGYCLRSNYTNEKSSYAQILDLIEDKKGIPWFLLEQISLQSKCNPYIHLDNVAPHTNKEWWDIEVPLNGWQRCNESEYTEFKNLILRELQTQRMIRKVIKNYK